MGAPSTKDSTRFRRALFWGILFWVAVGTLGILLRGVRWDEGFERAQAMLGVVPYPEGHPLRIYAWNAFSIHYYSSALLLKVFDSPLILCGLRDLLCVWGALAPVFAFSSLLTRNTQAGHLAGVLILANAHAVFRSYYANDVWPFMFTSGEMGLGWVFLCVCAFAAQRWRLAFFLLGMMPIIHLGQMPPVLGLGVLCFAGLLLYRPTSARDASIGLAAGMGITLCFTLLYLNLRVPIPSDGGYAAPGVDVIDVWKRFTYFEDIHRRPTTAPRFGPLANSVMGMLSAMLLTTAWLRVALLRGRHQVAAVVAFAYTCVCTSAVAGAWLIQQFMGMDTPYLVIGWLPYRLTNHAAVLLIAVVPAILIGVRQTRFPLAVFFALLWLALRPALATIVPEEWFIRYVSPPEGALFLLLGAAVAQCHSLLSITPRFRTSWTMAVLIGLLALLVHQQFLCACILLGAVVQVAPLKLRLPGRWWQTGAYAAGVIAIAVLLAAEFRDRKPLEVTSFEREMRAWFAQHGDPSGVLLTPFWTLNYQEKTGQPVFATFETPLLIPYIPALGPTIEKMVSDAYGVRFGEPWSWKLDLWVTRSEAEWERLAQTYGIKYVLSTPDYPLQLPEIMRGEHRVLYEIPAPH